MSALPALGLEHTYAEQLEGLYVAHTPEGFPDPKLLFLNGPLAAELGLDRAVLDAHGAALFSGTRLPTDAQPLAQAYAGHQFGGFTHQLGDGRAVLLGERIDRNGARRDLQLKGSGPTPFSRGGDGRATVGPILREYLMSEAMHALGVPTTRALAAVSTGETVRRRELLPGAVLTRVAASHLRVGTLQFFAARRDTDTIGRLVDYALQRHYPERLGADNPARQLLEGVAVAQATLIARWMAVGFVHGVMNTDNTTLSGETIDYGPCAFMDVYDPATLFSSIDHQGRYAYGNQPRIGQWNLARLAETVLERLDPDPDAAVASAQEVLDLYLETYQTVWLDAMRAKLGLVDAAESDLPLVIELLEHLQRGELDYTGAFRALAAGLVSGDLPEDESFAAWHGTWVARLGDVDVAEVATRMDAVNPIYIPRNHLVEAGLDAAIAGDLVPFRALLEVVGSPFLVQPGREAYAEAAKAEFTEGFQTFCGT